jgi:MYXO-CTERM domain-containing protein
VRRAIVPAPAFMIRFAVLAAMLAAGRVAAAAGTPPGGLAGGKPFDAATSCKSCHGGFLTDANTPFMPWDTWAGSMMANAARDPLFLASVSVAEQDHPGSGSFCLRCHTPSAYVESRTTPGNGSALNDVDREGVQCAVCHRSIDGSQAPISDANAPYLGDAQLYFDVGSSTAVAYHGPYDDSPFTAAHDAVPDPFVSRDDSRLCGQCHQVNNPLEDLYDASGTDTGTAFPLDTTYEEWQHSSFASGATAQSCQSCHMPLQDGSYPVGSSAGNRDMPPRHDFVGGNDWGPALVKAANPGLRDDAYDYTRATAQANLRAAAKLEIKTLPTDGGAGGSVDMTVRVTNLAGHKFPTGYADGRRAWIEVALVDGTGTAAVQSGAYDATAGTLTEDAQLRLYEAVHGRNGAAEDHIVLHRQILRDTRIPPAGFQPTAHTMPVGPITFSGGTVAYDDAPFHVSLPATPGADVTVRVRLIYQAMTAAHVSALAAANTTDTRGTQLMQLWQQTGGAAPFIMAEVTRAVHVGAPSTADAGADADGSTDAHIGAGGGSGGGCSCATAPGPAGTAGVGLSFLLALGGAASRRRARRSRR